LNSPRRPRVLVLDGHSNAAAAALLALPRTCELHVAAAEPDCVCFASRRVARRLIQPRAVPALRGWLEELDRVENYDLVIPSTEASLMAVKARDLEPRLRAKAVIPCEPSLDIALDKQLTLERAERLGIRIPRGKLISSPGESSSCERWPTVIKPTRTKVPTRKGTLSLSVRICSNAREREEALADILPWSPVLEQEYFPGRGFGVEALFEQGKLRWLFAHERIHELPIAGGASSYRRAVEVPEALRAATVALLGSLEWHGVAMVEFKVANYGDYRLMEINPRLWGSLPLAVAAGVNFPLGLLRIALGVSPGEQPRYSRRCYARDIVNDIHWFEDSLRERDNPLRLAPVRLADFMAVLRPLTGREHWDLFRWREPAMWWHMVRPALGGMRARLRRLPASRAAASNWRRLKAGWQSGGIRNVLVVCRGNLFRSPIVASVLGRSLDDIEVWSAGIRTGVEAVPPGEWIDVVRQVLGVDLATHRPRGLSADDMAWAQLILVMDTLDWRALSRTHPEAMGKAVLLSIAGADRSMATEIFDPGEDDPSGLRAAVAQLRDCTERLALQRNVGVRPGEDRQPAVDPAGATRQ
jgi:protein-tyrosine-phosphatase